MNDRFYAIFCRYPTSEWGQKATRKEAEDGAARLAEQNPRNEYFVMKTIAKYIADSPPPVIRTEIEPEN